MTDKTALRRQLRAARRQLTAAQQRQAATDLARRVLRSPWFARSRSVAFYLASDGEIDPSVVLGVALATGKHCFLPRIADPRQPHMVFARYCRGDRLVRNRFGIAEPSGTAAVTAAARLDLVLMPLVGFDADGNRLGMGGGFYDRTLAFKRGLPGARPNLVGLAHCCQQVDAVPAESWDIALDGVITNGATHRFRY